MIKRIRFKPVLFMLLLTLFQIPLGQAYSGEDFYRVTRDEAIYQALTVLEQTIARETLASMVEQNTKVLFKDMRELGKFYRTHDALTIITDTDQQIIYINIKHINAPPQALAAIISHEVLHNDRDNSRQEEVIAWHREGQTWEELLKQYPELKKIPPYTVPLVDRLNAILVLEHQQRLHTEIEHNVAYQGLPEHSPGF